MQRDVLWGDVSLFLQGPNLVLNQGAHGIGKLIQRTDPGKIPAVNGVGRGNVFIISGKDADHGNIPAQQGAHFCGGILDTQGAGIIDIALSAAHFDDIAGLGIREQDQQLMLAGASSSSRAIARMAKPSRLQPVVKY